MLWIGGGQGAGKSTLSWRLARAYDLPLHPIDLWAYDHLARMPAGESLDEQLARGPEAAALAFESVSELRLQLVLDDIAERELGDVPVLVEGPQLRPELATRIPPGWCVWLLPDPERTRRAREQRLAQQQGPAAGHILERDAILTRRLRESAVRAGRPVIEVPPDPDWPAIAAALEAALAPALSSAPRLAPGRELSRQRRYENGVAERQGRLWARAVGLTASPTYPFGCECGTSQCHATWPATPGDYAARSAAGQPLVVHPVD
jgi:hypothetical protein